MKSVTKVSLAGLKQTADDAIALYNNEFVAGDEPHYPQWAKDLLDLIDAYQSLQHAQSLDGLPVFCYVKEVHPGWPEFNKIDEFSHGRKGGEPLVKLSDVRALFSSRPTPGEIHGQAQGKRPNPAHGAPKPLNHHPFG